MLVPFAAVPTLPLERMFDADRVFLRSDTNFKLFPAGVHAVDDLENWLRLHDRHGDELVVLSEVVTFAHEYRCFVRNAHFVCGSSYPDEPYLPVPATVRAFAESAASRLLPHGHTMLTVDVGVSPDGTLRLVELGGVNSWGIYGSDVTDFITAMESEVVIRTEG